MLTSREAIKENRVTRKQHGACGCLVKVSEGGLGLLGGRGFLRQDFNGVFQTLSFSEWSLEVR